MRRLGRFFYLIVYMLSAWHYPVGDFQYEFSKIETSSLMASNGWASYDILFYSDVERLFCCGNYDELSKVESRTIIASNIKMKQNPNYVI